jgi:hypothetical protein
MLSIPAKSLCRIGAKMIFFETQENQIDTGLADTSWWEAMLQIVHSVLK